MIQIIPLSEGHFTVDKTKAFVPFDPASDQLQQRNRGSLLVEIQPFLLITEKDYILLDTGLGFKTENGKPQLHHNLEEAGISPDKITKVILSHLHKDHTGGISLTDSQTGKQKLSFPDATYYVNNNEWKYAMEHDGSSYHKKDLEILSGNEQVVLYEDEGTIDDYIRHERSGGHCPYHQVFWIQNGDMTCFYGADEAPQLAQLQRRFMAKYDFDGRKSMELRQQYLEQGTAEGWTFLFYHDIKTPFIKLKNN